MAANNIAVPGKNPGEVYIPALGKSFQQVELREDDIYDTIETDTGSISTGTQYKFFLNLTNKNEQHTNLPTPRRINSGDEAAIFRIGLHPRARGDVSRRTGIEVAVGPLDLSHRLPAQYARERNEGFRCRIGYA